MKGSENMVALENQVGIEIHSDLCENRINRASIRLENACENLFEERIFSESTAVGIFGKIENFFKSIIAALKRFAKETKDYVADKIRRYDMKKKLRAFYVRIEEEEKRGVTTVEMMDVWNLVSVVDISERNLSNLAHTILTKRYKHTTDMDKDFNEFSSMIEQYNKDVDEAMNKKIIVHISKAKKFVEDQITGNGMAFNTLDYGITSIEEMEREVAKMKDLREIYGADILPERIYIIRRIVTKFSNFLHRTIGKMFSKLIATVVFLLA